MDIRTSLVALALVCGNINAVENSKDADSNASNATTSSATKISPITETTSVSGYDVVRLRLENETDINNSHMSELYGNWMFSTAIHMYKIWPIMLCMIGAMLNTLSFVTFIQPSMRQYSSNLYLCLLAVFDQLVLIMCMVIMISEFYNKAMLTPAFCKIAQFLNSFAGHVASWLLVLVTIERFVVTAFPMRAGTMCTRRNVVIACTVIIVFFVGLNMHLFWTYGIVKNVADVKSCLVVEDAKPFFKAWSWVDITFLSFAPCIILFAMNITIIVVMHKAVRITRQLTQNRYRRSESHGMHSKQITITLLVVSIFFLVCTIPSTILFIYRYNYWDERLASHPQEYAFFLLLKQILRMILMCNNTFNFFLYAFVGKKFRKQLLQLFKKLGCMARPLVRRFSATKMTSIRSSRQESFPGARKARDYSNNIAEETTSELITKGKKSKLCRLKRQSRQSKL